MPSGMAANPVVARHSRRPQMRRSHLPALRTSPLYRWGKTFEIRGSGRQGGTRANLTLGDDMVLLSFIALLGFSVVVDREDAGNTHGCCISK